MSNADDRVPGIHREVLYGEGAIALDRLAKVFDVPRRPASPATGYLTIYGGAQDEPHPTGKAPRISLLNRARRAGVEAHARGLPASVRPVEPWRGRAWLRGWRRAEAAEHEQQERARLQRILFGVPLGIAKRDIAAGESFEVRFDGMGRVVESADLLPLPSGGSR